MSDPAALALTHWLYRRLYEIVRDAGDYGITRDAFAQKLYAHRTDGGPASNCIKQIISARINPRLAAFGLAITEAQAKAFVVNFEEAVDWAKAINGRLFISHMIEKLDQGCRRTIARRQR